MQLKNVMHLLIPCLIEHAKFLYGKNVVQTNEVRKNLENSFKVKMWFKQMKFVETLVSFQKNRKEPPCNILQRLKFF